MRNYQERRKKAAGNAARQACKDLEAKGVPASVLIFGDNGNGYGIFSNGKMGAVSRAEFCRALGGTLSAIAPAGSELEEALLAIVAGYQEHQRKDRIGTEVPAARADLN